VALTVLVVVVVAVVAAVAVVINHGNGSSPTAGRQQQRRGLGDPTAAYTPHGHQHRRCHHHSRDPDHRPHGPTAPRPHGPGGAGGVGGVRLPGSRYASPPGHRPRGHAVTSGTLTGQLSTSAGPIPFILDTSAPTSSARRGGIRPLSGLATKHPTLGLNRPPANTRDSDRMTSPNPGVPTPRTPNPVAPTEASPSTAPSLATPTPTTPTTPTTTISTTSPAPAPAAAGITGGALTAAVLSGAVVAAIVSSWVNTALARRATRLEERARVRSTLAEAFQAYADKEFPYAIRRRRADQLPEERIRVSEEVRRVQSRLSYYEAWTLAEAPETGAAYNELTQQLRRVAGASMRVLEHPSAGQRRRYENRPRPRRPQRSAVAGSSGSVLTSGWGVPRRTAQPRPYRPAMGRGRVPTVARSSSG